ncbi:hypothetical protein A3H40_00225 [Candidatus Daviesbacteria bacterium RIFCSPLOWO2_02_FULL_38_15]|uniref:Uncharacterized protein n=1 Tax=Candidatus Daviesbacteria bacterium RIFCSPLOWO2_02_FULL_38_15 TaxID=1797794 RepID=A0A1F5N4E9_9BACT|nr:MAG: hypothetical protein A3H40_00225 [Candidatus Daviesbacteria bacterium RIFCSPLOWO2_02_FULL_38_15]
MELDKGGVFLVKEEGIRVISQLLSADTIDALGNNSVVNKKTKRIKKSIFLDIIQSLPQLCELVVA